MHWRASHLDPAASESTTALRQMSEIGCSHNAKAEARPEATALQALYLDDVFRYVAQRVEGREEAEDITAETFAAAFAALPRFRRECPVRLWLLSIARRQIVNALRRRKSRPQLSPPSSDAGRNDEDALLAVAAAGDTPGAALERAEARDAIRKLVGALKEEQREALLLKYVGELSTNEIAVVMKRSPQAVNSLLQRGRKTLYERGRKYFLDDELSDSNAPNDEVTP